MGERGHIGPGGPSLWGRAAVGLLLVIVCGMLASAAVAASGTSATDQYDAAKPVTVAKAAVATSTPAAATPTQDTLPFTGVSLLSVVVIGGALVAVGFALRRRNARDEI